MTFERPEIVPWLLPALLILVGAILWQWRRSVRLREAFGGAASARRLTGRELGGFPGIRLLCVTGAAAALLLAAAGTRPGTGEPPSPPTPVDLVIVLDVSHSMSGRDVEPSRADRARAAVESLLEADIADRIAVTTFAGWPYPLLPVTDDLHLADYFIPWIGPDLVDDRHQGTAMAAAIGEAVRGWEARPRSDAVPVLVVLSDGEVHGAETEIMDSVSVAVRAGFRIWTAGVGTLEGAPLFVSRSSRAPLLGGDGGRVMAGYDPDVLRDIARAGGGAFHDIGGEDGVSGLTGELTDLRGGSVPDGADIFDPTTTLILLGLLLLTVDAMLDGGVGARRSRRWGIAWGGLEAEPSTSGGGAA